MIIDKISSLFYRKLFKNDLEMKKMKKIINIKKFSISIEIILWTQLLPN